MALGSGRTSLRDKFCTVMFALLLEAGPHISSLGDFAQDIVAGTFDLGVEFSLSTIRPTSCRALFPWFDASMASSPVREQEAPHANEEDLFDDVPDDPADAETVSLQNMLSVPGPLHILHNATDRLLEHLPYVGKAVQRLQAICRFLSNHETKQRLVSTCFSGPVSRSFQSDILNFHAKVNEGRWGSVAFAVPELLNLQKPLRRFWDLPAFGSGQEATDGRHRQDESGTGARLDFVHESIELPDFWAQLVTLNSLFKLVRELFDWLEWCPCHHNRVAPPGKKRAWELCPLRGRRLPEIACGELFEVINQLCLVNASQLFLELPDDVSDECRSSCLMDFEHGRGHLTFQLVLKMTCFLEPPLLLLGIAHHDPAKPQKQRAALHTCLKSDCRHPLVLKLQEGDLKEEAELFLGGEDLRMLDTLAAFMGSLRFAWGTERRVEGGHAQVNMLTLSRRHRHEATDSLALRLGEIKKVLSSDSVTVFLECVQAARSPQKLIQSLGMGKHPSCRLAKSSWDPIYRKIVYHSDPVSLYSTQQPELRVEVPAPRDGEHVLEPLRDQPADNQDLAPEAIHMQRQLALRRVRNHLSEVCKGQEPRKLFSCNIPPSSLRLLWRCLAPSQTVPALALGGDGGDCDDASVPVSADSAQACTDALVSQASQNERVFFRIVGFGLSRAKLATPGDFDKSDVGIVLLRGTEAETADGPCRVETSAVNLQSPAGGAVSGLEAAPLVLRLSCLTLAQLRSLTVWEESTSVLADEASGAMFMLVSASAKPLAIRHELPLADRSTYELVEQLLQDGWECVVARGQQLQTGFQNQVLLMFVDDFGQVWAFRVHLCNARSTTVCVTYRMLYLCEMLTDQIIREHLTEAAFNTQICNLPGARLPNSRMSLVASSAGGSHLPILRTLSASACART